MSKNIAITFPGQGSQSVGMLADLTAANPVVLETGPGKVLVGLIKRIGKSLPALPVFDPASLDTAMESINA
jgi:malonyl CoA-acyl carrier protein transacylase